MVNSCSANGCKNRNTKGGSLTFHRFPLNNKHLLKLWLYQLKRGNWEPSKYSVICSEHFTKDSFIVKGPNNRRTLKNDACPTIFSIANYTEPVKKKKVLKEKTSTDVDMSEVKDDDDIKSEEEQDSSSLKADESSSSANPADDTKEEMSLPHWYTIPKNGRRPQSLRKIIFKEEWPMVLDNHVSTRRGKEKDVACLKETLAFITCLKDNNNSQELCMTQGNAVQQCYRNHIQYKEEMKHRKKTAGDFMPEISAKNMDPVQSSPRPEFTENEGVEAVFEKGTERWRENMIKVFGDLHPYSFFITYGHSDERHLKADISSRERDKLKPFERLHDMYEIDKEAEEEFHKILSSMEDKADTETMNQFLEDRKKECVKVFQQFDKIIALCEEYFELEYADIEKRVQEQMAIQKPTIDEVERYLTEVKEAGDKEISILKDNIANYIRGIGLSTSSKIEEIYADIRAQPLIMEVWNKCSQEMTSKEIWYSFLKTQQDTALLWKEAFEDLMMLSSELERYRCNYNMTKSNLERAIYWMNRNYRDNMPELTKIQRQISSLKDRKLGLFKELSNVEREIKMEAKEKQKLKLKYYNKIASMRLSIQLAHTKIISKHTKVFASKKTEILELLQEILKGDQYIHEELLNKIWDSMDISLLEKDASARIGGSDLESHVNSEAARKKFIKTLHEDEFADAYRTFISNGNFVNVLNHIAEELGYMLDFQWVDYVKKTLEFEQKVRWLEFFKVFKIDFVEDIKDLKEHMRRYSQKKNGETVFDLNGVLDGFLHFVWLKRQSLDFHTSSLKDTPQEIHREFWNAIDEIIPKTLLWDSVLELLEKYREFLQSRKRLLATRFDMILENEELDKYLENYYSYNIPDETKESF